MNITLHEVSIREITENYEDLDVEGVTGYGGKLNIRPKYQREFVYDEKERNAVIETIMRGFPLNVMYWCINEDGTYEILDGQQRTVSFCRYVANDYSVIVGDSPKKFENLSDVMQNKILDYKVLVYFCEGTDDEKLDWFKVINTAGEVLTPQELRNATYTGAWLSNAKLIFSKPNCAAYMLAKDYVNGSPIRQELLEKALDWISKGNIKEYMSEHQHKQNANELWTYFQNVINWVKLTFPNYRKEMKGLTWGALYDEYKDHEYDTDKLEEEITALLLDDDVSNKKGVYAYVLSRNERHLNIRAFSESQKREAYERQKGICPKCGKHFAINEMQGDHITPWAKGGKTIAENCQMLCNDCNRRKSDI